MKIANYQERSRDIQAVQYRSVLDAEGICTWVNSKGTNSRASCSKLTNIIQVCVNESYTYSIRIGDWVSYNPQTHEVDAYTHDVFVRRYEARNRAD